MAKGFGSDNHATVHPQIMDAILRANAGHAPSYGTDELTQICESQFKKHFGNSIQVFFVFNGTAANVLSIGSIVNSYESVICADISHLNVDECGAPEKLVGCKLLPTPTIDGKIAPEILDKHLIRRGDQHYSQIKAISITQPTELGTVYSIDELNQIISWAKKNNLLVHMDGARLGNAAYSLNLSFKELTADLGVDVLSFGGTKNGLLGCEAIVFFNKDQSENFKFLRKQFCQLPSKTRFLAAQFNAYLENNLWKEIAGNACFMAQQLYIKSKGLKHVEIRTEPQSNAVFAKIPKSWVKPLRDRHFFYVWDEDTYECRWMTSWDTELSEIESFISELKILDSKEASI